MAQNYHELWSLDPKKDKIINAGNDFVVFINERKETDWQTSDEYDKRLSPESRTKLNDILNEAALLEAYPTEGLSPRHIEDFKALIGAAMACGFEEDFENGKKMLAAASFYIQARSQEQSRYWYVTASALMTLPFLVGGCAIIIWAALTNRSLNDNTTLLLISLSAGALGALFSVIGRSGNLTFASSSGRRIHYVEAASRIGTGVVAGIIVAFAVRNGFILSPLAENEKIPVIALLAAFVAGVSERLLTSIISTIDTGEKK